MRIVSRTLGPTLLLALVACGDGESDDDADGDADVDTDGDGDADAGRGFHLGTFELATYAIPFEGDFTGEDTVLVACSTGKPIATVPADFVAAIETEGMGKLLDGRVVVPGGAGGCYETFGPEVPWGLGSRDRPLVPFRSIAAHPGDVEVDRWLWLPEMDGVTMPGEAAPHDGCVRFDDDRNEVGPGAFSLFVGLASNEAAVRESVGTEVNAFQDSPECFGWDT